ADDFGVYVAPSISVSFVLGSLSADALYKEGKLNVVDGKVPPRLVAGLNADLEYAFDPPASQATHVNKFGATAFVDFLFTKELAFRLGIPVKAQIVTREADDKAVPKVTEKKGLQWSVPVFLTSAIKM
ncbi:MAG TPA: hypothetical protein VHP33_01535, partial [Polyangiaceae bacterium]|nr:hypothetical protein [Polyangiaceae bacterium]